jgi:hypothetical protein
LKGDNVDTKLLNGFKILDLFGQEATLHDSEGELWYGTVVGRTLKGLYIVALHGARTGQCALATKEGI